MENYDLYLNKYKATNSLSAGEDIDAVELVNQEVETSNEMGNFDIPEYQKGYDSDSASINGKDIDAFGSLSDEQVEAMYSAETITDLDKYGSLGKSLLGAIKKMIYDLHNPKTPSTPTDPTDPADPTNPTDPTDPTDPNTPDRPNTSGDPDDGTDGSGPATQLASTKTLSRGQSWTTSINGTEQVLTLANPFTGKNYQYRITSTTGGTVNNVKFEFLENGRLVITGDYVKLVACDNQMDDIVLLGNYCDIDTGDADDTVRVGYVKDSTNLAISQSNAKSSSYIYTSDGTRYYYSVGNKISTGSGNDYVTMLGHDYTVDMGENDDKFLCIMDDNITNVTNAEYIRARSFQGYLDGVDGWSTQGTEGDCRFLALINTLCGNNNNGSISDFATIVDKGSYYEVTFINYPATGSKKNTVKVTKSELSTYTGVFGDLDTIILDKALNNIIAINRDNYFNGYDSALGSMVTRDTTVENAYYNTIAKYLTGKEDVTYLMSGSVSDYRTKFLEVWNKYVNGEINNFAIGINTADGKLGIVAGHAYSVRKVDIVNGYIEIINPWDDSDCLRLTLDKFFSLSTDLVVYGTDIYGQNWKVPNGGSIDHLRSGVDEFTEEMGESVEHRGDTNPFSNMYAGEEEIEEIIEDKMEELLP